MKRIIFLLLAVLLLLSGCTVPDAADKTQYQASFLSLFDTVTVIVGYADSEEDFRTQAQEIHDELLEYHRLFDIYENYEGINNLKTINDNAGIAPVEVDRRILELLLDCRDIYEATGGQVNVAMGSVLQLWHEARTTAVEFPEEAKLPSPEELSEGAKHTGFDTVLLDEDASTVFITDPHQSLDVGAIAKGWAVEQVCRRAPKGLLISVGGNVRATGPRPTDSSPWVVGVQKPDGERDEFLHTLYVSGGSVVSSGDYQRYFTLNGIRYHHIIDPATGYPAQYWRAVTVLCEDSGLADALSTALFTLPLEDGIALASRFSAEAMWVDNEGTRHYTSGFETRIRT